MFIPATKLTTIEYSTSRQEFWLKRACQTGCVQRGAALRQVPLDVNEKSNSNSTSHLCLCQPIRLDNCFVSLYHFLYFTAMHIILSSSSSQAGKAGKNYSCFRCMIRTLRKRSAKRMTTRLFAVSCSFSGQGAPREGQEDPGAK